MDFLDILNKLADLQQHSSTSCSHGTFWHQSSVHPQTGSHYNAVNLLDFAHLNNVATKENDKVQMFAITEWQCIETKQEAFLTKRSLYNVHVFAILLMAALPYDLKEHVKHALIGNVQLFNDSPYSLITLYQLLFLMQAIYKMVLQMHLQKITLESCNNYYYTCTKKFLQCFCSVGPLLSVTNINAQWGEFHKQLNAYLFLDFCAKFTQDLLAAFHLYCKQPDADKEFAKKQCVNALVKIIEDSQNLNEMINNAQLPLKMNLASDHSSQLPPEIVTLMVHTTNSSNLLETLTKKVQAFNKCLNDLNHQLQELKHDSHATAQPKRL